MGCEMATKKIDLMYEHYGINQKGHCKSCCNLSSGYYRGKKYNKCIAYGLSRSEATDWKISNKSCGLYNQPFDKKSKTVLEISKHSASEKHQDNLIDGQMSLI